MFDYAATQARLARLMEKRLFFVVGASKSGTTWVQALLDGHPDILSRGEGHFTNALVPALAQALRAYNEQSATRNERAARLGNPSFCPVFDGSDLGHLVATAILLAFDRWLGDDDAICIGDKTPEHALAMEQLAELFPAARFIHIIRDGRDVCVSGWLFNRKWNPEAIESQGLTFSRFVAAYAEAWRGRVEAARAFGRAHPERYHELRYEVLHAEPEAEIARMLRFLEVDSSPEMVAKCREAGAFETWAHGRRRGEENPESFFRKGIVGDWRNHFDEAAEAAFAAAGGDLLKELGYA